MVTEIKKAHEVQNGKFVGGIVALFDSVYSRVYFKHICTYYSPKI